MTTTPLQDQLQKTLGGSYTIERELGGGGMSRLFLAEETSLGRRVVVKVLPPDLAASVNLERFRREIQLAARLQHPHIVPVHAAGVSDGLPYYTMPFIEGESLRARLARGGELPVAEAVRVLRDVLSAISYAHEHGVVHRDIKPDNILLTGPDAVVADFGVAKAISAATNPGSSLTSLGVALGTPAYMAPEQAMADPSADHRADIYAVGAVGYEMLTGHQVFSARSPQAMLAAHASETPEPLAKRRATVPPLLAALIMRALEKRPADRPQSAAEMLAQLSSAVTPGGATAPHIPAVEPAAPPSGLTDSPKIAFTAAAALLVLGIAAAYWYSHRQPGRAAAASSDNSAISTIAVLPFANTGGNAQDEYFSDGMTDELAGALSHVPELHVASRTSSYAFKGKAVPVEEIGKALHVGGVVEGAVRRSGNRLRITAQLTNATTGLVIWTDGFERPADNVFQVQDELTKAIVTALTPKLRGEKAGAVAAESRGTTDALAYDLYLRGRFEWNKRSDSSLAEGIRDFQRAVARDTTFARAYAALASSYVVAPQYMGYEKFPLDKALSLTQAAASRAMSLDSSLAEPHAALGHALNASWHWAGAEREFLRAIALDANYATAHQWYAFWLQDVGRSADALAEIERAHELDPLSRTIAQNLCLRYAFARDFAAAIKTCNEGAGALPGSNAMTYTLTGQWDSAAANWHRGGSLASTRGLYAYSLARGRHRVEATTLLRGFERDGGKEPLAVALAYLGFGDNERALLWLDRAVDHHDDGLTLFAGPVASPILDPLRGDPRFQQIIDKMGLTEYARKNPRKAQ